MKGKLKMSEFENVETIENFIPFIPTYI